MDYFSLDFVRYGVYSPQHICSTQSASEVVASLSPIELEKHSLLEDSPYFSTLNNPEFLTVLTEKWNLKTCKSFEEFMLRWLRENIFSPNIPLEYILDNYRRVYSTSKAVRVATRKERDDFCEHFLKKYPQNIHLRKIVAVASLTRQELGLLCDEKSLLSSQVFAKACRRGMKDYVLNKVQLNKHAVTAAIALGEVFDSSVRRSILEIAKYKKDASVFTDSYWLNHPNVDTVFSPNMIVSQGSAWLLKFHNITRKKLLGCSYVPVDKKLIKYYDKVGYAEVNSIHALDVEGLNWIVNRARSQGYVNRYHFRTVRRNYSTPDITYGIRIEKEERVFDSNNLYSCSYYSNSKISTEMIEWFEAKLE